MGYVLLEIFLIWEFYCFLKIKEFGSYIWDEKAVERGDDKPVKQHDHCMDAARYFAYTIIRRERKWS